MMFYTNKDSQLQNVYIRLISIENRSIMNKVYLLFAVMLTFGQVSGQGAGMNFTFDHYAINVSDLDRSVEFYQKYFFVEEIYDGTEEEHVRWFSLGNNQELHIIAVKDLNINVPKGIHMALTTSDLDKYIAYLEKYNEEYFDWPGVSGKVTTRPDKIRQVYIQDLDGYWIEINNGITRFDK